MRWLQKYFVGCGNTNRPRPCALRLDIGVATTNAQQSGVAMQDIVLVLLQRADELCHLAADQDVDMTRVVEAFVERPSRIFGRYGRNSATNEEPAAGARKKQTPARS